MRERRLDHAEQDRVEAAPCSIVQVANCVVFGELRDEGPCAVALDQERTSLGIDEVTPVLGEDEREHRRRRCAVAG